MVVIFAMGIGLFAPPFGVGYYAACAISKVDPDEGHAAHLAATCWRCSSAWSSSPPCRGSRSASSRPDRSFNAEFIVMSRFFGEIRQAGYVVPDIEAAMDYWSRVLGVGPWFYNPRVPIGNYRYRGEALRAAQLGGAGQLRAAADRTDPDAQRRAVDVPRLPAAPANRLAARRLLDRRLTTPTSRASRRRASSR